MVRIVKRRAVSSVFIERGLIRRMVFYGCVNFYGNAKVRGSVDKWLDGNVPGADGKNLIPRGTGVLRVYRDFRVYRHMRMRVFKNQDALRYLSCMKPSPWPSSA